MACDAIVSRNAAAPRCRQGNNLMTNPSITSRRQFLAQSALAAVSLPAMSLAKGEEASLPGQSPQTHSAGVDQAPPQVTRTIAEWTVHSRLADIPPAVRGEAVRSIV